MISSTTSLNTSTLLSQQGDNETVGFLFVGKSGAGKTTLINAFVNHFFERKYSDERLVLIPQSRKQKCSFAEYENQVDEREYKEDSIGESKTKDVKSYMLNKDGKRVLIIDTPGVGDTEGFQQDSKNIEIIINGIKKHAFIQAVIFVVEPVFRLDNLFQYYLNEIRQILTKSCTEQCLIVCTKNTGDLEDEIKEVYSRALGFTPSEEKWFVIENYYLYNKHEDESDQELFELQWEEAQQTIQGIYEQASKFPKIYTKRMVILFKKRKEVEKKVLELIHSVERHRELYKEHLRENKKREIFLLDAQKYIEEENSRLHTHPSKSTNYNCETCHKTCIWDVSRFGYVAGVVFTLSIYYWISEAGKCAFCGHNGSEHKFENYHRFVGLHKDELEALLEKAKSKTVKDGPSDESLILACKETIKELIEDIAEIAVDVENIGIMPVNYDSYLSYLDDYEYILNQNKSMDPEEKERLLGQVTADKKFYFDIKQNLQQARLKRYSILTDVSKVQVLTANGDLEKEIRFCPNDHPLKFQTLGLDSDMMYNCDICRKDMIAISYRCEDCNYDVCDECK